MGCRAQRCALGYKHAGWQQPVPGPCPEAPAAPLAATRLLPFPGDLLIPSSPTRPHRSLYPGDSRAGLVPFLAHKHFGDTYKWLLYMDDDTIFFPDAVMRLLEDFDPDMPYFITGECLVGVGGVIGMEAGTERWWWGGWAAGERDRGVSAMLLCWLRSYRAGKEVAHPAALALAASPVLRVLAAGVEAAPRVTCTTASHHALRGAHCLLQTTSGGPTRGRPAAPATPTRLRRAACRATST